MNEKKQKRNKLIVRIGAMFLAIAIVIGVIVQGFFYM
jgi:hypothetical protein